MIAFNSVSFSEYSLFPTMIIRSLALDKATFIRLLSAKNLYEPQVLVTEKITISHSLP